MSKSKVKVAAIQAAPVFLDLEASLQKALALLEKAAANGAKLLVFPEAFLPAWPAWVDEVLPGEDEAWHVRLLEQSVVVPGPVTDRLGAAARDAGVHLVMGSTSARRTAAPSTTRSCTSTPTAGCSASTASSCRPTPSVWCGAWVTAPTCASTRPPWAGWAG
jgi:predicted amidohydrolase